MDNYATIEHWTVDKRESEPCDNDNDAETSVTLLIYLFVYFSSFVLIIISKS